MDAGALCRFHESMGNGMFVSHQWITPEHPDPDFHQLGVLQKALHQLMEGKSRVTLPPMIDISFGRVRCPTAADFKAKPLYIWYDFFCCPQGTSRTATEDRRRAIGGILGYVAKCCFFVILCPSVSTSMGLLSHSTWATRGWCRLEFMARHLAQVDGFIITIKTPQHPTLAWNLQGLPKAPGLGHFSFEGDKKEVSKLLVQMVWSKLQNLLSIGDLHNYRFLLNLHHLYFAGMSEDSVESLVPFNFEAESIDPWTNPDGFLVARFLHDNLFKSVSDRDAAGWSPLCYAVLTGKVSLVKALLNNTADPNDCTTKSKKEANLSKKLPVLSIAATYHSNEVMKLLIAARANVNARCEKRAPALNWAGAGNNDLGLRLLLEAQADPLLRSFPDMSSFRTICGCGSAAAMAEMLQHAHNGAQIPVKLQFCLHTSLVFNGERDSISCLIEASADVNEQLRVPSSKPIWWLLLKKLHAMHHISPSTLTYLAYHHYGATPLIFSILTGKLETIPLLLVAGARLDIRNDRGKSALDFLQEMQVPTVFWRTIERENSQDTISIWIILNCRNTQFRSQKFLSSSCPPQRWTSGGDFEDFKVRHSFKTV